MRTELTSYKLIKKNEVWEKLFNGRTIKAVVLNDFKSTKGFMFREDIYTLNEKPLYLVTEILEKDGVVYFEKMESEE